MDDYKRLFIGFKIEAPWPDFPRGRILHSEHRHLTVAFLGDCNRLPSRDEIIEPSFLIGLTGVLNKIVFLPPHSSRVVAYHLEFLEHKNLFFQYQKDLVNGLIKNGFRQQEKKDFLAHVTIARGDFSKEDWLENFEPLPCFLSNLCLYESLGNSEYKIEWQKEILPPFDVIEHTADIAFKIRGKSIQDLYLHAFLALCFYDPQMIEFYSFKDVKTVEEIVQVLNLQIAKIDSERGSPFKAVSYHGEIIKNQFWEWEMIVDV